MARESLIQKRLDELAVKGSAIAAAAQARVSNSRTGRTTDYVSSPQTHGWGTSVLSLLRQAFGESSIHTQQFQALFTSFAGHLSSFRSLYAVLSAAKEDYEGGYIFNLRGLVKAEVLSDALEQAEELLNAGYKDPAYVLIGVSLEIAVKDLVLRQSLHPSKLDKMNVELCKLGVYNVAKQKQVTAWADLRNKAAHGDWAGYTEPDVRDMLKGVQRFIGDHL
jgi:hypothetical protein